MTLPPLDNDQSPKNLANPLALSKSSNKSSAASSTRPRRQSATPDTKLDKLTHAEVLSAPVSPNAKVGVENFKVDSPFEAARTADTVRTQPVREERKSEPSTATPDIVAITTPVTSNSALDARVRSLRIPSNERRAAPKQTSSLPWVLCCLLLIACGYLALSNPQLATFFGLQIATEDKKEDDTSSKSSSVSNSNANKMATNVVSTGDANPIALESRGYVIAKHQVLVSPQVSGRILSLSIEEGRRVNKGDILAEVEKTEYLADVEQMRGILMRGQAELAELQSGARPQEIAGATADLQEQEIVVQQLESDYKRLQAALKTNSISVSEFEQAQSSFYSVRRRIERLRQSLDMMKEGPRKERIEVARAAVMQAEANLTKAQWKMTNCTIRAPIAGTILKKNAEEGNLVNPIAFNGSYSVCDIADLSDLEIDLTIQERDISKVYVDQRCQVRPEAFRDRVYEARVSRLMPIADRAKGAVPVRVAVKVPEAEEGIYLKPEMSAEVVFFAPEVR